MFAQSNAHTIQPARPLLGVSRANPAGARVQRVLALSVMIVPLIGTIAAFAIAIRHGVSRLDLALLIGMYTIQAVGVTVGYHRMFDPSRVHRRTRDSVLSDRLRRHRGTGPHSLLGGDPPQTSHLQRPRGGPSFPQHAWSRLAGPAPGALARPHGVDAVERGHVVAALCARDLMRDDFVLLLHKLYPAFFLSGIIVPAVIGGIVTRVDYGGR